MTTAKKQVESPILQQYRELKKKHPDAMLLFRCGDFYELYDADASVASVILGITLTKRTGGDGVNMAGFPYTALETYLPKLVRAGKRVAICDSIDGCKQNVKEVVKPAEPAVQAAEPAPEVDNSKDAEIAALKDEINALKAAAEKDKLTAAQALERAISCALEHTNAAEVLACNRCYADLLGTLPYIRLKLNAKRKLTDAEINYLFEMAEYGEQTRKGK